MVAASRPQVVRLRSGDVVRIRQVRPGDVQALARAYARLGEESRYRRFFTARPELSDSFLHAAAEVDHENHEALAFARIVLLPVIAVRRALLADPEASGSDEAAPGDLPLS